MPAQNNLIHSVRLRRKYPPGNTLQPNKKYLSVLKEEFGPTRLKFLKFYSKGHLKARLITLRQAMHSDAVIRASRWQTAQRGTEDKESENTTLVHSDFPNPAA